MKELIIVIGILTIVAFLLQIVFCIITLDMISCEMLPKKEEDKKRLRLYKQILNPFYIFVLTYREIKRLKKEIKQEKL